MDYSLLLPTTPPDGLVGYVISKMKPMGVLAYMADYEVDPLTGAKNKVCRVTCTACETTWLADRENVSRSCDVSFGFTNPLEGIAYDGDSALCPFCGAKAKVLHIKTIGRCYHLARYYPMSCHRIGDTAALVGWWIELDIVRGEYAVAREKINIYPYEAYVAEGKKLVRHSAMMNQFFRYVPTDAWEVRKKYSDCFGGTEIIYPPSLDNLEGTPLENSKLDLYMETHATRYPVEYINAYLKHPNIENLVSSGAGELLASMLASTAGYAYTGQRIYASHKKLDIDWHEVKPSRMLGLTAEEYRRAVRELWNYKTLKIYRFCKDFGETPNEKDLKLIIKYFEDNRAAIVDLGLSLTKTARYLEKQKQPSYIYIDYLRMLKQIDPESREFYPPHLRQAHDRIVSMQKLQADAAKVKDFTEAYERYSPLRWTDGELELVVPQTRQELIDEGRVLHHCVGSYGDAHISGKPIFFVRHHRRPERSYYTLNIDMKGFAPKELQLHGYKNDLKCPIPPKVRAFVDRWEREILAPWFKEQLKNKKESAA